MEEKDITEKESLNIISEMLNRTNQDTPIGSGKLFMTCGYILTALSLIAFCTSYFLEVNSWDVFRVSVSLVVLIAIILVGRPKKKKSMQDTYMTKCIRSVWASLIGVFIAFLTLCIYKGNGYDSLTGLFLLGLLFPGFGMFTTGIILRERSLQAFGLYGVVVALYFLFDMSHEIQTPSTEWPIVIAVQMIVTLVIPGHILNYKSRKHTT